MFEAKFVELLPACVGEYLVETSGLLRVDLPRVLIDNSSLGSLSSVDSYRSSSNESSQAFAASYMDWSTECIRMFRVSFEKKLLAFGHPDLFPTIYVLG